jgi:hypothetical protein
VGTARGGETAAVISSITSTCQRHNSGLPARATRAGPRCWSPP